MLARHPTWEEHRDHPRHHLAHPWGVVPRRHTLGNRRNPARLGRDLLVIGRYGSRSGRSAPLLLTRLAPDASRANPTRRGRRGLRPFAPLPIYWAGVLDPDRRTTRRG